MCIHGEAGREQEEDHGHEHHRTKGKGIFANAASVLSMAAEEISLDDHLEKELANEVELWRLDTSSQVVGKVASYGVGQEGKSGLHGISTINGPYSVPFSNPASSRERSNSPYRTQVSLHNRVGGGMPGSSRPASGTKAASPVPQRPGCSNDLEQSSASSSKATDGRPDSKTPMRERTGVGVIEGKVPELPAFGGSGEGDGAGGPPPASAAASSATTAEVVAGTGASAVASTAVPTAVAVDATEPARTEIAEATSGGDAAAGESLLKEAKPEAVPAAPAEKGFMSQEKLARGRRSHATSPDGLSEGPPDPSADDREVDTFSSSDESTFVGFIEDPDEQNRVSEDPWLHAPMKRREAGAACADWDGGSQGLAPAAAGGRENQIWTSGQILHDRRDLSNMSDVEDVRPDRSPIF